MKALGWGANVVLIAVVGLALQGCGMKMVKQDEWLAKEETIASLRKQNETASAQLRTQTSLNSALEAEKNRLGSDLADMQRLNKVLQDAVSKFEIMKPYLEKTTGELQAEYAGVPGVTVKMTPLGPVLGIEGDILFDSGKTGLKDSAKALLDKIAESVNGMTGNICVSGFTDSDPILHSEWKTNLRLSGERAMSVIEALKEKGVTADRMYFAGYGEYRLVMEGGAENKKKSRHVEILIEAPEDIVQKASAAKEAPAKTVPPVK